MRRVIDRFDHRHCDEATSQHRLGSRSREKRGKIKESKQAGKRNKGKNKSGFCLGISHER